MREQGAGKAGLTISEGLGFFLKAVGVGILLALIRYGLPFLADFIVKLNQL